MNREIFGILQGEILARQYHPYHQPAMPPPLKRL